MRCLLKKWVKSFLSSLSIFLFEFPFMSKGSRWKFSRFLILIALFPPSPSGFIYYAKDCKAWLNLLWLLWCCFLCSWGSMLFSWNYRWCFSLPTVNLDLNNPNSLKGLLVDLNEDIRSLLLEVSDKVFP